MPHICCGHFLTEKIKAQSILSMDLKKAIYLLPCFDPEVLPSDTHSTIESRRFTNRDDLLWKGHFDHLEYVIMC